MNKAEEIEIPIMLIRNSIRLGTIEMAEKMLEVLKDEFSESEALTICERISEQLRSAMKLNNYSKCTCSPTSPLEVNVGSDEINEGSDFAQ